MILFKCANGMSRLQRSVTGSEWDHVGIVVILTVFVCQSYLGVFVILLVCLGPREQFIYEFTRASRGNRRGSDQLPFVLQDKGIP